MQIHEKMGVWATGPHSHPLSHARRFLHPPGEGIYAARLKTSPRIRPGGSRPPCGNARARNRLNLSQHIFPSAHLLPQVGYTPLPAA